MQYVSDRLFAKVSSVNSQDAALGAAGLGLFSLAAAAPAAERALADAQVSLRAEADDAAKDIYEALVNPTKTPSPAISDKITGFGARDTASNVSKKGRELLGRFKTPTRVGVGALGALLGAAGLYGALRD